MEKRRRDLAMFNLAIDSKLRGCDLVRLKIDDVCASGRVRDRTTVVQKKTGRPVQFEITEQTRAAVGDWLAGLGDGKGRYLFPSRFRERPHLSTRQLRPHSPPMGGVRRPQWVGLWHALVTPNEAGADLQEDRQPEGRTAAARAHEA
jgi:integrase